MVFIGAVGLLLALTIGAEKNDKTEWINGREAAAKEVLVKFRDASVGDIEFAKLRGGIVHAKKIGGIDAYRFRSGKKSVAALVNLFAEEPKVEYVEPNYILYADQMVPDDPRYPELWGMEKISAPGAWNTWTGSTAVTVGVVDTGVDYTHPDLAANVWTSSFAFNVTIGDTTMTCPAGIHGYDAISGDFDPMDDNNHGTHVSGTIGALGNNGIGVAGVNWMSSIMGLKFLGRRGSGSTADAIDAIEFAIQAKLAGASNVRVLSNSWGGGFSNRAMLEEIIRAYENDILFVCSAGNVGLEDTENFYPSTYNVLNMVVVAASNQDDYVAGFSNTGHGSIHLAAPGVDILSSVRKSSYAYYNGTSMAVPHVSGAAALIVSRWAELGVDVDVNKLRSILINSVDVVDKTPPPDYPDSEAKNISEDLISQGRLDVASAISVNPQAPDFYYFPDFVLRFTEGTKSVVRPSKGKESETYFDFTLTSYFGYEDDALEVKNECCAWTSIIRTFADLSITPNPGPEDFYPTLYVPLAPGEQKTIRMRVLVLPSASITQYGLTIHALDPEGSDVVGPYLYHNDTAYLNVLRR